MNQVLENQGKRGSWKYVDEPDSKKIQVNVVPGNMQMNQVLKNPTKSGSWINREKRGLQSLSPVEYGSWRNPDVPGSEEI